MVAEFADWLLRSGLALAVAVALVLALRPLWRRWLGSASVLWLWLLLPAALVATSWTRPTVVVEFALEPVATATSVGVATMAEVDAAALAGPLSAIGLVDALVLAWCLGALWMLLRLVAQQRRFLRRLGPLERRPDGSFVTRTTRIGPAVVGALWPRIVLPADFEERYDARQQALVLAHERCHLRRGDLQVNLLASAMRCVFWFNPLVHLAAARLRVDQELACDAAVLREHPGAGRAYASALLNTQLADLGLPVGCYWQSSQSLKWRIAMLKLPSPGAARLLAGATLALLASSAAAASLWQLQPVTTVAVPAAAPVAMVSAPTATVQITALATVSRVSPVLDLPALTPAVATTTVLATTRLDTDPPIPTEPAAESRIAPSPPPVADANKELTPPRVVTYVDATKPYRRSRTPDGGFVVVVAEIGSDGRLVSASVPDDAVTPVYRAQALRAVESWTFEPARRGDIATASTIALPVYFSPRRELTFLRNGIEPPGVLTGRPFYRPVEVESAGVKSR